MRLIHTEMDTPAAESGGHTAYHGIDQPVDLIVAGKENVRRIGQPLHGLPSERRMQMCQRLNARHNLDSKQFRIVITGLQFLSRVTSAESAKIRILRDLIRLFRIQHHKIHAQGCHASDVLFYFPDL